MHTIFPHDDAPERMLVLHWPSGLRKVLPKIPAETAPSPSARYPAVLVAIEDAAQIDARMREAAGSLEPGGTLYVAYPKSGAKGYAQAPHRPDLLAALESHAMTLRGRNQPLSDTWTALRAEVASAAEEEKARSASKSKATGKKTDKKKDGEMADGAKAYMETEPADTARVAGEAAAPVATEPMVTSRVAAAPVATEPTVTSSVAAAPMATEPVVTSRVAAAPVATEPVVTPREAAAPVATEPVVTSRVAAAPKDTVSVRVEGFPEPLTIVMRREQSFYQLHERLRDALNLQTDTFAFLGGGLPIDNPVNAPPAPIHRNASLTRIHQSPARDLHYCAGFGRDGWLSRYAIHIDA